jgi:PBSX family phage terminase large subunit
MSQEVNDKVRIIRLSPKQEDYIKHSKHSYNISSGVTRSGKTFAQAIRFHTFMQTEAEPKSLHLMSGRTAESLYDNLVRPILFLDKKKRVKVNARKTMMTYGDKEIRLVGCDNELATDRIQGKSVGSWWADEIVKHPMSFVNMAISRCSEGGKIAPKFWTCNPDMPNHPIKEMFIDSEKLDVKNWYFGFPDNPALSQDLIDELTNSFTGVFYDRMILGLWTVAEGIVYENFKQEEHVKDEAPVRAFERYVLGIDWGYTEALAMALYGVEADGTWWQVDEYKEPKKLIDESLKKEIEAKGWFNLPLFRFDGIEYKRYEVKPELAIGDSNRPEYIKLFHDLTGIRTEPAIKPDKAVMIQAVQKRYNKSGNGKYGLYHLSKCKKTLNEKMSYRWKDNGRDEVVKENDHLMDCEQYAIYTSERATVRFIKR